MFQFVVPSWAMMALSVVAVLFGMLGVRPQKAASAAAAAGGGSKQLPMFAVQGLGDDGDMTDDEHAKQVCCCCSAALLSALSLSLLAPLPLSQAARCLPSLSLCAYDSFKQPHGDMNDRAVAAAFLRHIRRDKSAKRIFAFLSLNFCFMSEPCLFSAIKSFCDRSIPKRAYPPFDVFGAGLLKQRMAIGATV
jgi:hypothetical protein